MHFIYNVRDAAIFNFNVQGFLWQLLDMVNWYLLVFKLTFIIKHTGF